MKIRTSINAVFLFVGIVSFIIMAYIFFELMRDHHKEGATSIAKVFLLEAVADNNDGYDTKNGIVIRKNWSDLPQEMRLHFSNPPENLGDISKSHLKPEGIFNPQRSYFVLYTTNTGGDPVYVAKELYTNEEDAEMGIFTMVYWRSILFSVIFATVFVILLIFILKAIVKPLEALKLWAYAMANPEDVSPEPIHFRYKELSDIADTINHSIEIQKNALKKEEEFLQFSSHELRTPLAVLRSNVDLIKKMLTTRPLQEGKVQSSINRMDNATRTMTQLVETFLHIGRDTDAYDEQRSFDLQNIIQDTLDELSYLNTNKAMTINLNTKSFYLTTSYVPCQIVLRNLFANALQHTIEGEIHITQESNRVRIVNKNIYKQHANRGFGLGLRLVEKMAVRYDWKVQYSQKDGLYIVEILF